MRTFYVVMALLLAAGLAGCDKAQREKAKKKAIETGEKIKEGAEETGAKLGKVAQPLRAALTGKLVSPPVQSGLQQKGAKITSVHPPPSSQPGSG